MKTKLILVCCGIILALLFIELAAGIFGFVFLKTRNRLIPQAKKNGQINILCLGDSYTFGLNVKPEESYPAQLEKALNKLETQNKFIVLNQGIPGTNSSNLAAKLSNYIERLKPDMIILLIGNADFGVFNDIDAGLKLKSLSIFDQLICRIKQSFFFRKKNLISEKPSASDSPHNSPSKQQVLELIYQANKLRSKQAYDQALLYYAQAIELDAQNPIARLELIRTLKSAQHFGQAINTALDLIESGQANPDIYFELGNIFQIINNPWNFIAYTATWQKNNPEKNSLIPNAKLLDKGLKQKLHNLIKQAYALYTVKDYDQAFDCYQEIYQRFNTQIVFKKEVFAKCSEPIKRELLTICIYGITNALLLENLDYITLTSKAFNLKLLFLSYPEFLPPAIAQIAESRQIPLIDLRPVFGQPPDSAYLQPSGHCTALGNQLIAQQIADYLNSKLDH